MIPTAKSLTILQTDSTSTQHWVGLQKGVRLSQNNWPGDEPYTDQCAERIWITKVGTYPARGLNLLRSIWKKLKILKKYIQMRSGYFLCQCLVLLYESNSYQLIMVSITHKHRGRIFCLTFCKKKSSRHVYTFVVP